MTSMKFFALSTPNEAKRSLALMLHLYTFVTLSKPSLVQKSPAINTSEASSLYRTPFNFNETGLKVCLTLCVIEVTLLNALLMMITL